MIEYMRHKYIGGNMSKIAFVFPGQGAQHTGMGMDLVEKSKGAKNLMTVADDLLDFDLFDLLSNEEAPINETAFTQPALVAVSVALLHEFVNKTNIKPDYVAGLSLGEYSAHVASGSLKFEDAITLVRKRGLFMEEAGKLTKGAMAAIVKGDVDSINKYCSEEEGIVGVANYNSPIQVVISGEEDSVKRVSERLRADKVRVIPLNVSGAFHSPLMEPAREELAAAIENTIFSKPNCPIYQNVTAYAVTDEASIKANLISQLTAPVRWTQSVQQMITDGATLFTEVGPGNVLQGLVKKINRDAETASASL